MRLVYNNSNYSVPSMTLYRSVTVLQTQVTAVIK